jgi:hypothetical protein
MQGLSPQSGVDWSPGLPYDKTSLVISMAWNKKEIRWLIAILMFW